MTEPEAAREPNNDYALAFPEEFAGQLTQIHHPERKAPIRELDLERLDSAEMALVVADILNAEGTLYRFAAVDNGLLTVTGPFWRASVPEDMSTRISMRIAGILAGLRYAAQKGIPEWAGTTAP
jgi:hypothetical protein